MTMQLSLQTPRIGIRSPEPRDAVRLLAFRTQNRAHLMPWEPSRNESHYTLEGCRESIVDANEKASQDRGYSLMVFDAGSAEIIATFNFANIVRGAFQASHLGYSVAAHWQGRGVMHEALDAGLVWAFDALGLHRVMANYMPRNERSARLLERLGFEREGYASRYLQIAGQWEDHILASKIRADI
jgi:[ribosomal protein S5]-alanine N-acetyltransferase